MEAWEHHTGIELDAWEAQVLRRLSIQYLNMSHTARKSGCPAPYSLETQQDVDDRVSKQFAAMMKGFAAPVKRGK